MIGVKWWKFPRRHALRLTAMFVMFISLLSLIAWIATTEGSFQRLSTRFGFQDEFNREMTSRHKERTERIEHYCAKYREDSVGMQLDRSNVIVVEDYKMVYCSVPKVACTVWKRILANLEGINVTMSVHRDTEGKLKLLKDYSLKDREKILSTYTKFMFVREPFERLLSAYRDCFWGSYKRQDDSWKRYRQRLRGFLQNGAGMKIDIEADNTTFAEFATFLVLQWRRGMRLQEHWHQQHDLCHPCHIHYDVIGHYETLEEDGRFVLRKTKTAGIVPFPQWNPTNTSALMNEYYSNLTFLRVAQLEQIYKKDFELFGFPYPGPLESVLENFKQSSL